MDNSGGFTTPPPPPPPPGGEGGGAAVPLAPKRPSEIIGAAFKQWGDNWRALFSISALFVLGVIIIGGILGLLIGTIFDTSAGAAVGSTVGVVAFLLFGLVLSGALTRMIATELVGQPIGVSQSVSWGLAHLGPIFVVALLVALISLAISVVGALLDEITDSTVFSSILSLVQLVVTVFLSFSIPALVVEGIRGTNALRRSIDLVKPYFWHALGTYVLTYLVVIAGSIIAALFIFLGPLVLVAFFALFLFLLPFFSLVTVLLYVNLRVKSGGTTQETLRSELAANA